MSASGNRNYLLIFVLLIITIMLGSSSLPTWRVNIFSMFRKNKLEKNNRDTANKEVESLRRQVALLSWELYKAKKEVKEHSQFREKFPIDKIPVCIPANIIVKEDISPMRQSFIVDRGSKDGVTAGSLVVTGRSLIGRVYEVGLHVSRVLHITDPKMRLKIKLIADVITPKIQYGDGVCIGRGKDCQLKLVEKNYQVWKKAYVVTMGYNGEYPPGLLIGTVEPVGNSPKKRDQAKHLEEEIGMFWDLRVKTQKIEDLHTVLIFDTKNMISELDKDLEKNR